MGQTPVEDLHSEQQSESTSRWNNWTHQDIRWVNMRHLVRDPATIGLVCTERLKHGLLLRDRHMWGGIMLSVNSLLWLSTFQKLIPFIGAKFCLQMLGNFQFPTKISEEKQKCYRQNEKCRKLLDCLGSWMLWIGAGICPQSKPRFVWTSLFKAHGPALVQLFTCAVVIFSCARTMLRVWLRWPMTSQWLLAGSTFSHTLSSCPQNLSETLEVSWTPEILITETQHH